MIKLNKKISTKKCSNPNSKFLPLTSNHRGIIVGAHDCARKNQNISNKPIANAVGVAASHACDICNSHRSNSYPNSDPHSRGITLVALIITIIVMLVLVGVSVTIAIKGDLFGIAKRAAKGTEDAKRREQELASGRIKIDGTWYDSFEDYVIGKISDVQGVVDLNESNTKFKYTPEGWTNGEVKVEINVEDVASGYFLKYSTDNINWEDYTGEIIIDNNRQIYAKLVDSDGKEGGATTANVGNIDKEAPQINTQIAKAGEETDTSIPLSINATDSLSGISKIEWYYKKSTDPESEYAKNKKTDEYKAMFGKEAGEKGAVTKETTLTGLLPESTYNIYAIVYDVAGNSTRSPAGTSTIEITTKKPAVKPQVGDYVLYEPDTVTKSYLLEGKYSGYGTYNTSVTPNTFTTPENQSISQESIQWQILKIHDNGSMELIGTPTSQTVHFQGALGYNNGVYLLNDICKKLYSKKGKGIYARSVSIEDFEDDDNGGNWKSARNAYTLGIGYNNTKTITDGYYPNLYAKENGSGINTEIVKTDGIGLSNNGYESQTEETWSQANINGLTTTQTFYSIAIDETNYGECARVLSQSNAYWIATRSVFSYEEFDTIFVLRSANTTIASTTLCLTTGSNFGSEHDRSLRPIISLPSTVSLTVETEGINGAPSTFGINF